MPVWLKLVLEDIKSRQCIFFMSLLSPLDERPGELKIIVYRVTFTALYYIHACKICFVNILTKHVPLWEIDRILTL